MKPLPTLGIALLFVVAMTLGARSADSIGLTVAGTDRSLRPGDVARLTVVGPAGLETVAGRALGQHVHFYPHPDGTTWQGLLGIDLDTRPANYPLALSATRTGGPALTATIELRVTAKRFPTRRLRVASQFVDPPATDVERIRREAERLSTAFSPITPRHWEGPFLAPLAGPPSSNFGSRSIYNGEKRSPHAGVDFGGDVGASIAAPNAGDVVLAEDLFFTGNTVIVDHGLGLYSLFAHLSRVDVVVGQSVVKGEVIGLLGATGRVTAPHLHWAVRLNGARVNPLSLVEALN